jgi:PAS domain S-box-containing protein
MNNTITKEDWELFIKQSHIIEHLPGIQGVGYNNIIPAPLNKQNKNGTKKNTDVFDSLPSELEQKIYTSIVFIAPLTSNLKAMGYDTYSEPIRRKAMAKACDNNIATLSGKLKLIQENDTGMQAGSIIYLPVYTKDMPLNTVLERRKAIKGWVSLPCQMNNLFENIVKQSHLINKYKIHLQIYDDSVSLQSLLFDSQKDRNAKLEHFPQYIYTTPLEFNGTRWMLKFTQYEDQKIYLNQKVVLIASSGLIISILLFILSFSILNKQIIAKNSAKQLKIKLKESEARFSLFMEHLPAIVFIKDNQGKTLFVNKYMDDKLGASAWIGKNMVDIFPNEFGEKLLADDLKVLFTGYEKIEESIPMHDGILHYFETQKFSIPGHGKDLFIGGISLDITERKKVEHELIKNEERFKNMFKYNNAIMLLIEKEGGEIIDANITAVEFYGYSIEKLRTMSINDINILPANETTEIRKKIADKTQRHFNFTHKLANGELRKVESYSSLIDYGEREVIFAIMHDITEREKLANELKESEARFKNMFEKHASIMLLVNPQDGKIIDANLSASKFYGYTRNELKQMCVNNLNLLDLEQDAFERKKAVEEKQNYFNFQHRLSTGEIRMVEIHTSPIYYENSTILFSVLHDITERKKAEEKLNYWSEIFNHARWGIAIGSADANSFILANREFAEIHGYTTEELTEIEIYKVFAPECRDDMRTNIQIAHQKGHHIWESIHIHKDGTKFPVLIDVTAVKDKNDNVLYRIVNLVDISERKQTEQALHESNQKWQAIISASPDGIGLISLDGKLQLLSDKLVTMYGYSVDKKEELHGKSIFDFIHPSNKEILVENIRKLIMGEKDEKISEYLAIKKDKTQFYVDVNSTALKDSFGNITSILFIERDITDRKQTEQTLSNNATKFKTVVDYNYDWEFWISPVHEFIYISPSCEKITGYSPEDFISNADLITQIIHPDDSEKYRKHDEFVHTNKTVDKIDFRIITKQKEIRWINHVCQPVFDENGKNTGIRGSNRDITDRKLAELKINELNSELIKLNADKDRFISILAHDLRSPFSSILGFLSLLNENIHSYDLNKIEHITNIINEGAKNTFNLLEDILLWTRANSGKIPFEPQRLTFETICFNISENLKLAANNKNISIKHLHDNVVELYADKNMLQTILLNLVANAIKFTNNGGEISIYAVLNEIDVVITVADNGIGMEEDILSKLFDITEKVTTSGTANEKGTGLGLLLCKEFVEKHSGKIWVESKSGKGSKFNFTMPLYLNQTQKE